MTTPWVSVLMGSQSDAGTLQKTFDTLAEYNVPFEAHILSAHRSPAETVAFVQQAEQRGCAVFIAAAGLAAHLAGTVAAHTVRPVIGIPMEGGPLKGMDALLSTVQMPGGTPVATVSIGSAGAANAAILAIEILATNDQALTQALRTARDKKRHALSEQDKALMEALPGERAYVE